MMSWPLRYHFNEPSLWYWARRPFAVWSLLESVVSTETGMFMKTTSIARSTLTALALVSLTAIAACSSPSQIHTRDGRAIPTADKPEVDKDSGFVKYERDGREVQINQSDVQAIEEIK